MGTTTIHRGLRDMKVAAWSAENSWGTAYDVYGAREMGVDIVVETDQLEGDDVVLDRYTNIIAVTCRFANAAVDMELLSILTGAAYGSTADYEDLVLGEGSAPYVGIAGRIVGSDATHEQHLLIPKAKLAGNINYQAAYGQYVIPQAEFQGVHEGSTNGILRLRKFTAPTALEIPLRIATGGL